MNPLKRKLNKQAAETLAHSQYIDGLATKFPTTNVDLTQWPKFKDDDIGVQTTYEGGIDKGRDAILTAIAQCNSAYSGVIPISGKRFRWWHCKDNMAAQDLAFLFRQASVECVICTREGHHNNVRAEIRKIYGPEAMASETCGKCQQRTPIEKMARPGVCTSCYEAKPSIVVPAGVI